MAVVISVLSNIRSVREHGVVAVISLVVVYSSVVVVVASVTQVFSIHKVHVFKFGICM